ncbi:hypothetical protein HDU98_000703 [Podochytrium sp. JEL0797]|nr:hypothetical protein HDU98_000703 [Podochytrium sp. JEL0797]
MEAALVDRISTLSQVLQHNQAQLAGLQDVTAGLKLQLETARAQALEAEASGSSDATVRARELQRETRILNHLIKQYEATIEVIMAKFRLQTDLIQKQKQTLQQEFDVKLAEERAANEALRQENIQLQMRLQESVDVIRRALDAHEEEESAELNEVAKKELAHKDS